MTAALSSSRPGPRHVFELRVRRFIALSADGSRLFACNTPDNRLSVYQVSATDLTLEAEIPVGLEPISVRPRTSHRNLVVTS
jgi:hypothetical protein